MPATGSVLSSLAAEGVRHVFLVPGQAGWRVEAGGLTPIVACHEAGAAFMADGYARATGRFGVCLTGAGPGATNLLTAAAAARADASPVLYLTTSCGDDALPADVPAGRVDDVGLLGAVTTASFALDAPETLAQGLRFALTRMLAGPGGPVHLRLGAGLDAPEEAPSWERLDEGLYQPRFVDDAAVERLWRILVPEEGVGGPTRVAVLAGAGVEKSGATSALVAFAEAFEIPVATTLRAKGVFPEHHRLALGVFGGDANAPAARALHGGDVEVLVVLGCGLSGRDTFGWDRRLLPQRALVHVDVDQAAIGRIFHTHVPVVGDCRAALSCMLEGGSARVMRFRSGNAARAAWVAGLTEPRPVSPLTGDAGCGAAAVASALREALPRDGAVVVDSGAHQHVFASHFTAYGPRTYFAAAGRAPLGWAVAAAIGIKAARPERAVACVVGGGCMLAHGMELTTAVRHGLDVVYVVLGAGDGQVCGGLPPGHDFAAFARSLGARGLVAGQPEALDAALADALGGEGPCVVNVNGMNR